MWNLSTYQAALSFADTLAGTEDTPEQHLPFAIGENTNTNTNTWTGSCHAWYSQASLNVNTQEGSCTLNIVEVRNVNLPQL